jgi:hypothetical protein
MWPVLPASDYYGGSAPSRADRWSVRPAHPSTLAARRQARSETVPVFTVIRSTKEEPDCVPAASPRVRRSPSSWPPGRQRHTGQGVPRPQQWGGCAPPPAQIHQVRAGVILRDVTTPVPRVLLSVSLTRPTPSGSTGPSWLCRGCSHPPRHHPDQAAPSYADLLRQARRRRSPTSTRITTPHGANRRNYKSRGNAQL